MELNKELLARTDSKPVQENIIFANNVRVTVLTQGMIRVEYSTDEKFTDLPSQSIWYRNFGKVEFSHETKADVLTIKTAYAEFYVNCHTGAFKYAVLEGKKISYHSANNLKGTTRTLDGTYGPKELDDGVISTDGVSIYDDSKTLLLNEDGMLSSREKGTKDYYVFVYGKDYVAGINNFYKITGAPPLVPRYVLGNWWSRYRAYTQKEYLDLMNEFAHRDIPLTVATVDMDWHWVDLKKQFNKKYKSSNILSRWHKYNF